MHLYIDPSISGISGDMFLGACIEIGLQPEQFAAELKKLNLTESWQCQHHRSERGAIAGTKLDFTLTSESTGHHHHDEHDHSHDHDHDHDHDHSHQHKHTHGRHFTTIRDLIHASSLSESVKSRSIAMFERVGHAEAAIHGKTLEEIHFHEVGALDSILDIVGAAVAIELLGITHITAAIPVDGHGSIECAHGIFPVPAPATLKILADHPIKQIDVASELITPTGAAILAELVSAFGPMGDATILKTGYGLGTRELPGRPNVLRLVLCEASQKNAPDHAFETDRISLLETNIDDITGERLGHVASALMDAGALDVTVIPVLMKKGRPGHQLQIMCSPDRASALAEQLMRTTGSLGIRIHQVDRWKLSRQVETVSTPYGDIRVKTGSLAGSVITRKPEADDILTASRKHGVSEDEVIRNALK
jgi:hypothetical protein